MQNLIKQLESYQAINAQEEKDRQQFLSLLNNNDESLYTRENKTAHITASAWITNKTRNKILLAHHNIYNSWAWLGGHADGEMDLSKVAIKEAKEESGLKDIKLLSNDIASIEILPVGGHIKHGEYVSAHLHLNITYFLVADENETLHNKADENSAVAWFDINEVVSKSNEAWIAENIYQKLNDKLIKL